MGNKKNVGNQSNCNEIERFFASKDKQYRLLEYGFIKNVHSSDKYTETQKKIHTHRSKIHVECVIAHVHGIENNYTNVVCPQFTYQNCS